MEQLVWAQGRGEQRAGTREALLLLLPLPRLGCVSFPLLGQEWGPASIAAAQEILAEWVSVNLFLYKWC